MSKIEKLKEQQLTAINDADLAALTNAARDLAPNDTVGLPLKYTKGRWLVRETKDNEVEVGANDRFVVDILSYSEGWIRWANKKPTHKLMGRRVDGFISPLRDRLPEFDKESWPIGPKGREDPWQENQQLIMRDLSNDQLLTWTTSSWGGRLAIGELLDAFVAESR